MQTDLERGEVKTFEAIMLSEIANNTQAEKLFLSLAEQIKLPFLQISQSAELIDVLGNSQKSDSHKTIQEVSKAAIMLIDGFLLSVKLQNEGHLDLDPVPVSSVLYDTAQILDPYARLHNCDLHLEIVGKYEPVMANREVLKSALVNLGYSFINRADPNKREVIKLAVRRNRIGTQAGVFSEASGLTDSLLKKARRLEGTSHQPLNGFISDSGAGIFVADRLFELLGSRMRTSRLGNMNGLASTFMPSSQLTLV